MEYFIYCDESLGKGKYYSDFFGGALVKSAHFEEVKVALEEKKAELNLKNEIKWVKVTENYLQKYMEMIDLFFSFIEQGKVKVRIMFRDTEKSPLRPFQRQDRQPILAALLSVREKCIRPLPPR